MTGVQTCALPISPREVLEVVLQSTVYIGMPRFVRVVALLERIFKELGVFEEITRTMLPLPVKV